MNIQITKQNQIAILHPSGSLDADSVASFKKTAYKLVEEGFVRLILDGKALQFVDSTGLGVLIALLRKVRSQEGDLKVAALTADVASIFEITRLNRLFESHASWEVAAQKFAPPTAK